MISAGYLVEYKLLLIFYDMQQTFRKGTYEKTSTNFVV